MTFIKSIVWNTDSNGLMGAVVITYIDEKSRRAIKTLPSPHLIKNNRITW
ncbi:MAG: hypothetical protein ABDH32_06595 [Candidatus Caldarchaeales archaeon]